MIEEKDQLTDHDYDGIREYNNPLPAWWLWTFLATIGFAFLYYIHYELGGAPSMQEDLQNAMAVIAQKNAHAPVVVMSDEVLEEKLKNGNLELGASHFQSKCAACHGNELQGGIGPNLTDEFWVHGAGSGKDIMKVVKEGVLEKGMPAWSAMLKDEEIISVVAYIISKQNSNPKEAKAPQGEKVR